MPIQAGLDEVRFVPATEFRFVSSDKPTENKVAGYAAKFNVRSAPIAGMFIEKILPGAFRSAIKDADVLFLVEHDRAKLLGRTGARTLSVEEDATGLRFEGSLPDTTLGRDVRVQLERGDLSQMSFAFRTKRDIWHDDDPSGLPVREIVEFASISDVSLVAMGQYPDTEASLRALEVYRKIRGAHPRRLRVRTRLAEVG